MYVHIDHIDHIYGGSPEGAIRNWASRQTQSRDWSGDNMHVCCAYLAIESLDVAADVFLAHHVRGIPYSMQHRLGHERIMLQPVHPHKIA